ncbi:MAG: polyamine ABC transporter ATP-binding protein [Gammaproteobacteria bacterium]|nr:polyamine ABC transporter ATP-binding protein [Gammaproteobacteria bacterium]
MSIDSHYARADSPPAVSVLGVSKSFGQGDGRVVALDDVVVDIGQNEFFTLLGPSGCGKTTLLRLIAGFDHPSTGALLLDGTDVTPWPPYRRPVNTVFQSYALFPHMSVAENIAFGLKMLKRPAAEIEATVDDMLNLVQMIELRDRRTDQISGGQQQRVALARALAPHPKVLLLDEPLSALDYKLRKNMQLELKRLQHETGITFVFVTHDQEEALTMSDRIAVMNKGRILQIGSPQAIYDQPAVRFVADFIGDTNFLAATLTTRNGARGTVRMAPGSEIEVSLPSAPVLNDTVTIAVRPEHARLTAATHDALLRGSIENIVYRGTDTRYDVRLFDDPISDGAVFVAHAAHSPGAATAFTVGQHVGVHFPATAVQVLAD